VSNSLLSEVYDCPSLASQLYLAKGWKEIGQNEMDSSNVTTEIFHRCGSQDTFMSFPCCPEYFGVSIPLNFCGFTYPVLGIGYIGSNIAYPSNYQEIPVNKLISPLDSGVEYTVSLYLKEADVSFCTCDTIKYSFRLYQDRPYVPHGSGYKNPEPTGHFVKKGEEYGWIYFESSFISTGNERYLALGDFRNESEIGACYDKRLYRYIDAVALYPSETPIQSVSLDNSKSFCHNEKPEIQLDVPYNEEWYFYWMNEHGDTLSTDPNFNQLLEINQWIYLHYWDFRHVERVDSIFVEESNCSSLDLTTIMTYGSQ